MDSLEDNPAVLQFEALTGMASSTEAMLAWKLLQDARNAHAELTQPERLGLQLPAGIRASRLFQGMLGASDHVLFEVAATDGGNLKSLLATEEGFRQALETKAAENKAAGPTYEPDRIPSWLPRLLLPGLAKVNITPDDDSGDLFLYKPSLGRFRLGLRAKTRLFFDEWIEKTMPALCLAPGQDVEITVFDLRPIERLDDQSGDFKCDLVEFIDLDAKRMIVDEYGIAPHAYRSLRQWYLQLHPAIAERVLGDTFWLDVYSLT